MLNTFSGLELGIDLGCCSGCEVKSSVRAHSSARRDLPAAAAGSNEAGFLPSDDGLFRSLAGLRLRRDSLVRETGDRERRSKREGFRSGSVWSKRDRLARGASSAMMAI